MTIATRWRPILRDYVHTARPQLKPNRAFLRVEPPPGERFEVDWGHFGVLDYAGDKRKLYAFALVEAHSRMLYLEFTHSQTFETFVRCHAHAFTALGGGPSKSTSMRRHRLRPSGSVRRQLFLLLALTHDFCYRRGVVAS